MDNITYINIVGVGQLEIEGFPHIVEKLETYWGYPDFMKYYNDLMVADRPNRVGFPEPVVEDLLFLYNLYLDNLMLITRKDVPRATLKKFHEETGTTVIVITHEQDIADYAERQILMEDGIIKSSGLKSASV